jgi:hypothetical protein
MKFSIIAGLALAGFAVASPAVEPLEADLAPELEKRTFFGCLNSFTARRSSYQTVPSIYEVCVSVLTPSDAEQIVNKYISILQNQTYYGQSVQTTASQIIAPNYVEYSDSILSLEQAPVSLSQIHAACPSTYTLSAQRRSVRYLRRSVGRRGDPTP